MNSYRQALEHVGQRARIDPEAFVKVERRRRRRVRNRRIGAAFIALAVAAGGAWGTIALTRLNDKARPAAAARLRTTTASGITVTFPSDWTLIQHGHAGVDPQILNFQLPFWSVFQLSNYRLPLDPSALCPVGQSMPANGVLLYVQRIIGTGDGWSTVGGDWPIAPQLTPVSAGALGDCAPGYRQHWHVGDRRFAALIAFGPKASVADRRALLTAFRSMDFRWIAYQDRWMRYVVPSSWDSKTRLLVRTLFYTPKQVLTSMTSGRQRFTFTAMPDPKDLFKGVGPTLEVEEASIGPLEPPGPGEFMIARRYFDGRLHTVVGSVTLGVARVDIITGGRTFRATLVAFPPDLPGAYRGYVFSLDGISVHGGEIVARDAQGRVLQHLPLLGP
jgi:hypothetical protein